MELFRLSMVSTSKKDECNIKDKTAVCERNDENLIHLHLDSTENKDHFRGVCELGYEYLRNYTQVMN